MKKMMMLVAILALAMAAAVPAIAQVGLEAGNEAEREGAELAFEVEHPGNFASQCVPALQFGNTGNFNNTPTFLQYASESDDFEPGGIEFSIEPEQAVDCSNTIQQSAAASG